MRAFVTAALCGLAIAATLSSGRAQAQPAAAPEPAAIGVQVEDPRAFGHLVGDVLTRRVVLDVPRRLKLVEASVPAPGRIGQSFELRDVDHQRRWTSAGTRHTLSLRYQVFRAPREPIVLDLPAFTLRFEGDPREEQVRVDFAPVGMVPLVPTDAVLRTGFGTLRPDMPAPTVDTQPERLRLVVYAVAALLPLGYLGYTHFGLPWRQRRQRPFAQVQRHLRTVPLDAPTDAWLDAWRRVHGALDATAGEVLHVGALDGWMAGAPRQVGLREELMWFFERSQAIFFAGQAPEAADRKRLLALSRRLFDIERGTA